MANEGPRQLEFCLKNVRQNAPTNVVRVVSDGVDNPEYRRICEAWRANYVLGCYLRRVECGGAWWDRALREGLATGAPWFLSIHPDTRFWRPFRTWPRHAVTGTASRSGELGETINGGCVTFTRDAAERILSSGLTYAEVLEDLRVMWSMAHDLGHIKLWYPMGYLGLDHALIYMLRTLDIEFGSWSEIGSRPKTAPFNSDFRYAVTHPHRLESWQPQGVASNTPIRIIVTCMGRLHHLKRSLPTWLNEPNVSVVVVDWSCPQGTGAWVKSLNDPRVEVVSIPGKKSFNQSAARNAGATYAARYLPDGRAAKSREIWAFVDADIMVRPNWAAGVRESLREGCYHVADPHRANITGTAVLRPSAYFAAGGYDETLTGWGCDDLLFYLGLRHAGIRPATWPGDSVDIIGHTDAQRGENYDLRDTRQSHLIAGRYYRLKARWMRKTGLLPSAQECRRIHEEAKVGDDDPWESAAYVPTDSEILKWTHEAKLEPPVKPRPGPARAPTSMKGDQKPPEPVPGEQARPDDRPGDAMVWSGQRTEKIQRRSAANGAPVININVTVQGIGDACSLDRPKITTVVTGDEFDEDDIDNSLTP